MIRTVRVRFFSQTSGAAGETRRIEADRTNRARTVRRHDPEWVTRAGTGQLGTPPPAKSGWLAFVLLFVVVAGACGGGDGPGSATTPGVPPSTRAAPASSASRGAPRWETVTRFSGTGPATPPAFSILEDSIQWRVRWTCDSGRLQVTTDPPPRRPLPLVDSGCPGRGEGFAIVSGEITLDIKADGPWELVVDQQVDLPAREPPFEGMASAPVLRQGSFYSVDKAAKGTARLYRRADGATVLRLEDFEVTANVDLFLWLSEASEPKTSAEVIAAPYRVLGGLTSTVGDQNYVLPSDVALDKVRSLVIWCEPVRNAYGAAPLAGP